MLRDNLLIVVAMISSHYSSDFSEESLQKAADMLKEMDFTRCVRADGSAYGTAGECRKGTPEDKPDGLKTKATSGNNKVELAARISELEKVEKSLEAKLKQQGGASEGEKSLYKRVRAERLKLQGDYLEGTPKPKEVVGSRGAKSSMKWNPLEANKGIY
jgi:hypothetical protein